MCEVFFFFQAEDGIRDYKVTGVQTCALPICILSVFCWKDDLERGRITICQPRFQCAFMVLVGRASSCTAGCWNHAIDATRIPAIVAAMPRRKNSFMSVSNVSEQSTTAMCMQISPYSSQ